MKTLFLILALISTPALANECKTNKINLNVSGLVCDFCARAIENTFSKNENVAEVKVDLENGKVTITTKKSQTIDDKTLGQIMTDAGYTITDIKRGC